MFCAYTKVTVDGEFRRSQDALHIKGGMPIQGVFMPESKGRAEVHVGWMERKFKESQRCVISDDRFWEKIHKKLIWTIDN